MLDHIQLYMLKKFHANWIMMAWWYHPNRTCTWSSRGQCYQTLEQTEAPLPGQMVLRWQTMLPEQGKKTSLKLGSRKTPFEPWKTNHPIRSKASVSGFLLEKHPKSMPRYSGVWRQNAEVNSCLSHGKDKGWSHSMVIMVSFCCASNKFDLLRRSPVSFLGLSAAIWQRLSLAHSHLRHFPIVSGSIQVLRRQPHIRLTACGYELTNTATTLIVL